MPKRLSPVLFLILLTGCPSDADPLDAATLDAGTDTGAEDSGPRPDGGADAALMDAGVDAAAEDAGADGGVQVDAGDDGGSDAGTDVGDAGNDAGNDAGPALPCDSDLPTIPGEFSDHTNQAFCDHFDTFDIQHADQAPGGTWATTFHWGSPNPAAAADGDRVLFANPEDEWYVSEFYRPDGIAAVNPFTTMVDRGRQVLRIRAEPAPAAMRPYMGGRQYTSGMISTHASFAHQYGFGVIRVRLPGPVGSEKGSWPSAWWLRPDGAWPPEFDLLDNALGADRWVTAAPGDIEISFDTLSDNGRPAVDFSADYHEFGFGWTPTELSWWLDGVKVRSAPTPDAYHQPMFFLFTLAVGSAGAWDGNAQVTPQTRFPLDAFIDAVWVYQRP